MGKHSGGSREVYEGALEKKRSLENTQKGGACGEHTPRIIQEHKRFLSLLTSRPRALSSTP
jgi:hypothetical protein|tara:strand:+ start:1678 stop:1860 length:183 start_codon:yes stop_codon:yes gene_type:complete